MQEVEALCDRRIIIHQGKIILEGDVAEIKRENKENKFELEFDGTFPPEMLADSFEIVKDTDQTLIIQAKEGHDSNELLRGLLDRNITINSYRELLPSLNEIFIKKVGESNE